MFFEKEIVAKTDRFISDRYLPNIQKTHIYTISYRFLYIEEIKIIFVLNLMTRN